MKNALVIYHANCLDGFTAAWIAEAALSQIMDTELVAAQYKQPAPLDQIDADTQVYVVDFSYPPEQLTQIAEAAHSVVLLDHHKSAFEQLAGYVHPKVQLILDNDRSGAGISWTFFNGTKPMPDLVAIVQDRDLWRFHYEDTKAITEAMYAREMTLEEWDKLADTELEELAAEGRLLLNKKQLEISHWIRTPMWNTIGGCLVPTLNVPAAYSSDVGHELCNKWGADSTKGFAATYQDKQTDKGPVRIYSLRSNGFDVAAIAKLYGGGGHNNAAGFTVPLARIGIDGPLLEDRPAGIQWENPLEEAKHYMEQCLSLIDKAIEGES